MTKPTRPHEVTGQPVDLCPDRGTCHHLCGPTTCFRVRHCGPLSGVYPNDQWPTDIHHQFGTPTRPLRKFRYAGRSPNGVNLWWQAEDDGSMHYIPVYQFWETP